MNVLDEMDRMKQTISTLDMRIADLVDELNLVEADCLKLEQENNELKEYIRHKPGCKQWSGGVFLQTDIKCTCGLDNLVSKQVITLL